MNVENFLLQVATLSGCLSGYLIPTEVQGPGTTTGPKKLDSSSTEMMTMSIKDSRLVVTKLNLDKYKLKKKLMKRIFDKIDLNVKS